MLHHMLFTRTYPADHLHSTRSDLLCRHPPINQCTINYLELPGERYFPAGADEQGNEGEEDNPSLREYGSSSSWPTG